jgi:hypothetical protein
MASVLVLSRCALLLLFLLATGSQALNVGNLLGTPPAVRTRGRRAETELSEVVLNRAADGLIRGLVVFGRGARVAAGRANPRSARVRTPRPCFYFREVSLKNLVMFFLLFHVLVLCSLHLVFL